MAQLRIHGTDTALESADDIRAFLADYQIDYEFWNIDKLAAQPARDGQTPQEHVLEVFADEIAALQARGGYQAADVIALKPDTPNLDAMLSKFDKEHLHDEDEVRFVVSGRGVFTIHGEDDKVFDVEVHPGDLLVVPEGTWHWFTLCEDRQIQCIRVFSSTEGWTPHYRNDA